MNLKENKKQHLKYLKILMKKNDLLNQKIRCLKFELDELKKTQNLLSVEQLQKQYGISMSTLERYRRLGLKVNQPVLNGRIFICPIEFEKFLKEKNGRQD